MKRLFQLTLLFAVLFAIFILVPPFLGTPFGLYPLMKNADVFDLFTPLVLIPIYWLLFDLNVESRASRREMLVFLVIAALWVLGQGMHLAANSIGHLVSEPETSDLYRLTYFYDERLSHLLWHAGMLAMMGLLLYRQWRHPLAAEGRGSALGITAGIIYGFTLFLAEIEGVTVAIGFPVAVLVLAFGLLRGRKEFHHQPLLLFFFVACVVLVVFFTGWGIYWGGWPEPSQVGLL
jgi:hypothetical protein